MKRRPSSRELRQRAIAAIRTKDQAGAARPCGAARQEAVSKSEHQEKCGAPQVQSRRFPWHTPSKEGFFTANEGSRGVANARAWHCALALSGILI